MAAHDTLLPPAPRRSPNRSRLPLLASLLALAICVCRTPVHADDGTMEIHDPWETMNRKIFAFNDALDVHIVEPVAQGYHDIMPDAAEEGVHNFFLNLRYPVYLLSDLVQFKFSQALDHTGRFLVNSTVGILGFIDVAKHLGLPDHEEDFGLALAYHGVAAGPYLMLPILGPSNVRDAIGRLVDTVVDPFAILSYTGNGVDTPVIVGAKVLQGIDLRTGLLEAIQTGKESSIDYYLFAQGAYYQYRRGVLHDGQPPDEDDYIPGQDDTLPSSEQNAEEEK